MAHRLKAKLEVRDLTGGLNSPYGVIGGPARDLHARYCFLKTDICRFIERNQMSYWTKCESRHSPVLPVSLGTWRPLHSYIAVYLNITDEQYALLKMKLDDPTKLTVIEHA